MSMNYTSLCKSNNNYVEYYFANSIYLFSTVLYQDDIPCEYIMKVKPTEYGFCYTFDGTDANLTFNARTTGSKAGVQFMLWVNQSNYYIADEDTAGFKVRTFPFSSLILKCMFDKLHNYNVHNFIHSFI